jgi:AGCS family alanine or glycine:cation symporter
VKSLENFFAAFATYAWGPWLLVLLFGGGLFFLFYSRFVPFRFLRHSLQILSGRYDDPNDIGDISHFQALSSALAGTIGMGNISGVAIAIYVGGPGSIFWMWMSALVGTATKFFTCSLAIMYRGQDSLGRYQGGPMYVITQGMGKKWKPLAVFFSVVGLVGCLPAFQANQLTQIFRDVIFIPHGWVGTNHFWFDLIVGLILASLVSLVIFGGIVRIGAVTSKVVPAMVVIYMGAAIWTLVSHFSHIPEYFSLIISDAFTGKAVAGGALWTVVITGIRRAAFSNEAGIGTEEMAHGAARTDEPVREGLVAMMGPFIDTIIVCTTTALMILITGVWKAGDVNGVTMTARAFEEAIPGAGDYILFSCVLFFSLSTMFSYSYYGTKCLGFLIGAQKQHYYNYFYVTLIVVAAVVSLTTVINIIDGMYALMAIPTMISSLYLAPSVMKAARDYFRRLKSG